MTTKTTKTITTARTSATAHTAANDTRDTMAHTPALRLVLPILVATMGPEHRWTLEGWAKHLAPTRHQNHAAASFAKHAHDFGEALDAAWALTVARCCDFGTTAEEARELILAAMHAHASKAVA